MRQTPTVPTTCDNCGKHFNTDRQHPRSYCSIACEEGRRAPPISEPESDGYHLHVKAEPEALVGNWLHTQDLDLPLGYVVEYSAGTYTVFRNEHEPGGTQVFTLDPSDVVSALRTGEAWATR